MEILPYSSLLSYSLAGVAAICFIEKFIPVMPSYVMLVVMGMTLVSDQAELLTIVGVASVGSILGGYFWYLFGRAIGPDRTARFVDKYGKYFLLKPELYDRLTRAYRRNHFWVTAIGQVVPTARIYLALPAGVIRQPGGAFLLAMTIGTIAWNGPLISLGYLLQDSGWSPFMAGATAVASLLAIEGLVFFVVYRRRAARAKQ